MRIQTSNFTTSAPITVSYYFQLVFASTDSSGLCKILCQRIKISKTTYIAKNGHKQIQSPDQKKLNFWDIFSFHTKTYRKLLESEILVDGQVFTRNKIY